MILYKIGLIQKTVMAVWVGYNIDADVVNKQTTFFTSSMLYLGRGT